MQKFHQYNSGREVTVENDHKPLAAITSKPIVKVPARLQAMLLRLQMYDYTLVHVPGKDMHLAEALSIAFLHEGPTVSPAMDKINSVVVVDLIPDELTELQQPTFQNGQPKSLMEAVKQGWPATKQDCA